MKKLMSGLVLAVALALLPAGAAEAKGKKNAEQEQPEKPQKMPDVGFDMPSQKMPPPKTCSASCDMDRLDCDAMCKAVANDQGAGACKKACVDVQKDCMDQCKNGG